jgi:zinc/manganese transport system substrate-binding protein
VVGGQVFARAALAFAALAFAGASGGRPVRAASPVDVVAAEGFYGDVVRQIGGAHVRVTSIVTNPNTDPHAYESSTRDATAVAAADVLVENGIGYDDFMHKLAAASPRAGRAIVDAGELLHRKPGDNPHVWFEPGAMTAVAKAVARELTARDPGDARDFRTNLARFERSLEPWTRAIASVRARFPRTPVAVTEPVFNGTLAALGADVRTPVSFQHAIEEGTDPAPQDVATMRALLRSGTIKAFIYNRQTVEPSTTRLLALARAAHVPVVAVYETMPATMTYQRWMLAEVAAVEAAFARGISTEALR